MVNCWFPPVMTLLNKRVAIMLSLPATVRASTYPEVFSRNAWISASDLPAFTSASMVRCLLAAISDGLTLAVRLGSLLPLPNAVRKARDDAPAMAASSTGFQGFAPVAPVGFSDGFDSSSCARRCIACFRQYSRASWTSDGPLPLVMTVLLPFSSQGRSSSRPQRTHLLVELSS